MAINYEAVGALIMGMVLFSMPPFFHLHRSVRPARSYASLFFLASVITAVYVVMRRAEGMTARSGFELEQVGWILAPSFVVTYAVAMGALLYHKWIGGHLTEEERQPRREGLAAWLSPFRIFMSLVIAFSAWQGYGYSFWAILLFCLALLAAYPLFSWSTDKEDSMIPQTPEELSAERTRVLAMLESGKINAEECSELLSALGETLRPPRDSAQQLTPARKLLLAGGAVLVVAFFLPWFRYDVGGMMTQKLGGEMTRLGVQPIGFDAMPMQLNGMVVSVSGGDVARGLGWLVLLLGLGAAALPFTARQLSRRDARNYALAALVVGLFVLLYVIAGNLRYIHVGAALALVAYATLLAGTLREHRTP